VSAEPSASVWEVTRLILDSPGASPSEIAQAHGFTAAEVADLLPFVLDNARADWSQHGDTGAPAIGLAPPAAAPGEDIEQHAERYLSELARGGGVDVVGYGTQTDDDQTDFDPAGLDLPGDTGPTPASDGQAAGDGPAHQGTGAGEAVAPVAEGPATGAPPALDVVDGVTPTFAALGSAFDLGEDDPFVEEASDGVEDPGPEPDGLSFG